MGSSCFTLENDSLNYPILSQLTNSDLNHIDYDYIDFNYLEANKVNVNFRRGQYKNKWLDPSHLEEIENLENELLFDKKLTFFEKSIILKSKNRIKPACKFCSKEYKAVNKFLLNHEISCPLNPLVAKSLTLHSFKVMV